MFKAIRNYYIGNKNAIWFWFCIVVFSLLYNYPEIFFKRPGSIHQWRQADCLSITKNYYEENLNFFEPAIHWVGESNGKTVSEFPVLYYCVAKIWELTGQQEFIFRMINTLIVFLGLFSLYKLVLLLLGDIFWSLFIALLVFTSPVLVFYTNNFLTDAPAFGLVLIASYLYIYGILFNNIKKFNLSFVFFLFAGLIKISSIQIFFSLFAIHFCVYIFKKEKPLVFSKIKYFAGYIPVLLLLTAWYMYAKWYNINNVYGVFLTDFVPIWSIDEPKIKEIALKLWQDLLPQYFNLSALLILLILFFVNLIFLLKQSKFLFALNILNLLGIIFFIALFYSQFTVHDYYLINILLFIPIVSFSSIYILKNRFNKVFKALYVKIIFSFFIVILLYRTTVINRLKYNYYDWFVSTDLSSVDKKQKDFFGWLQWYYNDHYKAYETITPYLRSLGISRTDRVLSMPDESINITLYLMDQKGFSNYSHTYMNFDERIAYYKKLDVKYMVIDSILDKEDYIKPYIINQIGKYKNLKVYKLPD